MLLRSSWYAKLWYHLIFSHASHLILNFHQYTPVKIFTCYHLVWSKHYMLWFQTDRISRLPFTFENNHEFQYGQRLLLGTLLWERRIYGHVEWNQPFRHDLCTAMREWLVMIVRYSTFLGPQEAPSALTSNGTPLRNAEAPPRAYDVCKTFCMPRAPRLRF